jgi:hypothetical protein
LTFDIFEQVMGDAGSFVSLSSFITVRQNGAFKESYRKNSVTPRLNKCKKGLTGQAKTPRLNKCKKGLTRQATAQRKTFLHFEKRLLGHR